MVAAAPLGSARSLAEAVAPAAFPEQAATSLLSFLSCPLHRAGATTYVAAR